MGQITQTTTQLQTILNDANASNAGNTSISDASDTTATSLKKSGFYSLQASSSNAPSTDRAVVISAVRDTAATGEIRYGQVVITESNGLWWNSDDGGSLGTWYESVGTTATQTLTNKTLTSPVLTTPQINDSAADHQYVFAVANLAADRTVTLPLLTGADTFVFEAHAQTLTNKILTAPVLSGSASAAGSILFKEDTDNGTNAVTLIGPAATADVTVTLPAATDTLVGKATTDTLTNKTITSVVLNTGVSGSAVLDEDNMASNSATKVATQQSIKAYVDAQVDTADSLSEILAIGNTTGGTDIATTTTDKLQFRDPAIYINSSVDSQLDIVADGKVQIASNVDLNGNLDVSGTALVTGVLTTTATQVATGGITSGSSIVSDTDSTDDLGTTSVRWANLFVDGITATDQITATGFTGTLDGILGSGAAAAATVTTLDTSGAVNLNLVTDSSSSTSGALIVDGGVGIAKKLYVGTDLDVDGTANLDIVDIDGAVNMATTALVTGVLTTTATQVATGGITSGSDIISDTDSTDSLGSTAVRWLKGWFDTLTAGTLTIGSGSVTDSSGAISFGNENLTTTGTATAASLALATGATVTGVDNGTLGTSATLLATQGAIKTYVDAQVDTADTLAEVLALGNTTGGTDLAVSAGDDITFTDSSKAIFGAGSDLQIYHDGSHSYIEDAGTGSIKIKVGDFRVENASGNNLIKGVGDVATLHHAGAEKLATASGGVTVTGTLTPSGVVTANAGVVVDNFTLDGTTLALSSGDFTVDVAGDIILDADGADIKFKHATEHWGSIYTTGDPSHMYVQSIVAGSSLILASVGGTALTLDSNTNATFAGTVTANAGVVVDNITIDGNEIDVGSGDLTLDVAGDIILDADGGDFRFKDAGTTIATYSNVSGSWYITSNVSDGDIVFQGNDNGSTIGALTLDMSAAGAATFNSSVAAGIIKSTGSDTSTNIATGAAGVGIELKNTSDTDGNFAPIDFYNSTGYITARIGAEFQNAGDRSTDLFFATRADGGGLTEALRISSAGALTTTPAAGGHAVFNEAGIDADFRVEGNTRPNLLVVDGGKDMVGIGTTPDQSWGSNSVGITIGIADTDAGAITWREISGADDFCFTWNSYHDNTNWKYASNNPSSKFNMTNGTHVFATAVAGSADANIAYLENLEMNTTGAVFNDGGIDLDFRVESSGNANMLFMDGGNNTVCIGTSTASGDIANTSPLTVGRIRTLAGSAAAANATATTLVTLPAGYATYLVQCRI